MATVQSAVTGWPTAQNNGNSNGNVVQYLSPRSAAQTLCKDVKL